MRLTTNEYRAVALALIDSVSDNRSERTALWVAGMDSEAFRYYARHHGLIDASGKVNPIKVSVPSTGLPRQTLIPTCDEGNKHGVYVEPRPRYTHVARDGSLLNVTYVEYAGQGQYHIDVIEPWWPGIF